MTAIEIRIQKQDFNQQVEYENLRKSGVSGAIVTFVGLVRDFAADDGSVMTLSHYPGMTEKSLRKIAKDAAVRWALHKISIVHRVGQLHAGDQIVFVGVSSAHRSNAFRACEFIMDFLKTKAPFWKKEGEHWVEAKSSDQQAAEAWNVHD